MVYSGINYNISLAVTYGLGVVLGFLINRLWTFAGHQASSGLYAKSGGSQFFQYLIVYLLIFIINFVVLNVLVQLFELDPIFSQLISVGLSTLCSYVLQKTWVFR